MHIAVSDSDEAALPLTGGRATVRAAVSFLHRAALAVAAIGLVTELLIVVSDVLGRALFNHSFLWSDEASKLALSTIAFIGGSAAYRDGHHTSVRVVSNLLSPAAKRALAATVEWIILLSAAVAFYASFALIHSNMENVTPVLQISSAWIDLPYTIGTALLVIYAAERLVVEYRPRLAALAGILPIAVLATLAWSGSIDYLADNTGVALGLMLALFFAAVLCGLPVSFAMLGSTLMFFVTTDAAPMVAVPQNMVDGTGNFVLLALPFFILAGAIMEQGGISVRLVRFAMALVGRLRGGLLQVVVVTIYLVSGISGSKVADVAAVGAVMRSELRRRGYRASDGAAVLAASAAMAETIPPSIAMLVMGSVTPISIGTLFIAGLLPAAVIAACLMLLIYLLARRRTDLLPETERVPRLSAFAGAILPLAMPVAMVVGIRFGIATPTEVSSFAVVYGVLLATLVYREVNLRGLVRLAMHCAATAGMVLFVIAAASSFAWVLAAANLSHALVALLSLTGSQHWLFMIGSIILLVIIGSLLEGLPAIIILAPLLLPIATRAGYDPVQYGIVLILAMGVGAFMPPIGIGFYVSAAISGSQVEEASKVMLPYLVVLLLAILLIAFVPAITLLLPHLLG